MNSQFRHKSVSPKETFASRNVVQRFPPFGLVAQLAERPVVCGRVEGATPFESAILPGRIVSSRRPRLERGGRECNSPRPDHSLPDSVKVAQRPVKPCVLVRVQVWQPFYPGEDSPLVQASHGRSNDQAELQCARVFCSRSSIKERVASNDGDKGESPFASATLWKAGR